MFCSFNQALLLLWSVKSLRSGWWPYNSSQPWFIIIRSLSCSGGLAGVASLSHVNTAHCRWWQKFRYQNIIHWMCDDLIDIYLQSVLHHPHLHSVLNLDVIGSDSLKEFNEGFSSQILILNKVLGTRLHNLKAKFTLMVYIWMWSCGRMQKAVSVPNKW